MTRIIFTFLIIILNLAAKDSVFAVDQADTPAKKDSELQNLLTPKIENDNQKPEYKNSSDIDNYDISRFKSAIIDRNYSSEAINKGQSLPSDDNREKLVKITNNQDQDMRGMIDVSLRLFEPALIIIMGAIVLFIVLAVMLPIFSMDQFAA